MKEYIYPAIFHKNNDDSFTVTFPDLPGCITEGKTMGNALRMAQAALTQWIDFLHDEKEAIPKASEYSAITPAEGEAVSLVQVMLSLEAYNNLMENLFIVSNRKNYQHILEGVHQLESGHTHQPSNEDK